jgi:hypothetical protein
MNDQSPITPVIFNEATRKFQFQLLPPGCHNLLLSNHDLKGIMLYHLKIPHIISTAMATFLQKRLNQPWKPWRKMTMA